MEPIYPKIIRIIIFIFYMEYNNSLQQIVVLLVRYLS